MSLSEQKLNDILKQIIDNYGSKGSITTNALCDIMEKYETTPNQMDYVYKSIAEAGIQIIDEAERDRELYEQALSDIGLDDPVKMYLKDIGRVPLLSADDEIEFARKMQEGDEEAKKVLIERNMRLVAHISKKYQNAEEDMEDLISIGAIGLIKAVSTFQEGHGSKLATYAARCIENELLMYFRSKKKCSREVSLYEPIGTDKEGNQIQLVDIVEVDEKDIVEQLELKRQILRLYELIPDVLDEREKEILRLRYGLNNHKPVTQRELAEKLHISRSYVSRIEKKALEKLKNNF